MTHAWEIKSLLYMAFANSTSRMANEEKEGLGSLRSQHEERQYKDMCVCVCASAIQLKVQLHSFIRKRQVGLDGLFILVRATSP